MQRNSLMKRLNKIKFLYLVVVFFFSCGREIKQQQNIRLGNRVNCETFLDSIGTTKIFKYFNMKKELVYYEQLYNDSIIFSFAINSSANVSDEMYGKVLFNEYCGVCHDVIKEDVGPPLFNANLDLETILEKHNRDVLKGFGFIDTVDVTKIKKFINNRGFMK